MFNHIPRNISGEKYQEAFPILKNGDIWMSLNRPIEKDCIKESALQLQMKHFFGVDSDVYGDESGYGGSISLFPNLIERNSYSNGYAYAEYSYLNASERSKMLMENAIRSTAIGAQKVWEVTPLKMAEMYGRLASMNQNYELTISADKTQKHKKQIYKDLTRGYREARPLQMEGMNRVISSEGTARSMVKSLQVEQKTSGAIRCGKYYLYAKTGTINSDSRNYIERHRLGVVIANKDLTEISVNKLNDVKFYVVYFTFDKTGQFSTYATILDEIMKSETFKQYMK